jgi:Tol biopolymer transport system component
MAYTTVSGVHVMDVFSGARTLDIGLDGCDLMSGCDIGWSPDGASLAVANAHEIELIEIAVGTVTPIVTLGLDNPASPAWSPDGEWIVFAVRPHLYLVRPDGSQLRRILSDPGLGPVDPTWTPDRKHIAFISVDASPSEAHDLWVTSVNPDGSDRRRIAQIGTCACLGWWPPGLAWSPDGTQMAVVTRNFGQPDDGGGGLYVASAEGKEPRQLLSGVWGSPTWQAIPKG